MLKLGVLAICFFLVSCSSYYPQSAPIIFTESKGEVQANAGIGVNFYDFSPSINTSISYAPIDNFAGQLYINYNAFENFQVEVNTGFIKKTKAGTIGLLGNGGLNYFNVNDLTGEPILSYIASGNSYFFGPNFQYSYRFSNLRLGGNIKAS